MKVKFDLEDIQSKFNRIVKHSQILDGEVNSNLLFEDWLKNKKAYIDAWDGQLIKELGEYSFHLSDEQRSRTISNVIDQIEYLYRNSGLGYPDFRFDDLISFILENQDNFFENVVNHEWNFDGITVPKGMKLLRAFKFFCNDKELLNNIQSVASMAIQNDKITGILCMSVHPFDYLSVSENVHNWRSCHALNGEYRAGNLNYMADDTTVVCYLKSAHKAELPRFPKDIKWNSKKWRVLLFFDECHNIMMAGRQYPFFENSLLLPIKKEVERMFEGKFSGWMDTYITNTKVDSFLDEEDRSVHYEMCYNQPYLPVGHRLLRLRKLVFDGEGTLQFNDLLESSTYTQPYYSFRLKQNWYGEYYNTPYDNGTIPKIRVGKKCKCLECNKEDITMSESFLCKHCMIKEGQATDSEEFGTCYWCGRPFLWDEGQYIEDEHGINRETCPECLKIECAPCIKCGTIYHKSALENGVCEFCTKVEEKPLIVEVPESVSFFNRETGQRILSWDLSQADFTTVTDDDIQLVEF